MRRWRWRRWWRRRRRWRRWWRRRRRWWRRRRREERKDDGKSPERLTRARDNGEGLPRTYSKEDKSGKTRNSFSEIFKIVILRKPSKFALESMFRLKFRYSKFVKHVTVVGISWNLFPFSKN
jgi:hypothetical protein